MTPASHVFTPDLRRTYPVVDHARDVWLYARDGRRWLDAAGGAMVVSIGHGVPEVLEEIRGQLERVAFVYRGQFTSEPTEALAALLSDLAPAGFGHAFFVSGGSEATESAIKLARRYHLERGEPRRTKVLARWQSYHGNTLGALALSGHAGRRRDYVPMLPDAGHIAPVYCYRCPFGLTYPSCRIACADDLERAILNEGPENVAAFIAEPIVMTLGVVGAVPGYFAKVREICDRYGVLLIADEVITGFWRTGPAFACETWGALPDLITCAKGMASGYAPLGAVLVREPVVEAIRRGTGQFAHGYTYAGNPLACAAGLATLDLYRDEALFARAQAREPVFAEAAMGLKGLPNVLDIRVVGLAAGIDLAPVPDEPGERGYAAMEKAFHQEDLLVRVTGDTIAVSPPLIASEGEIADIFERLARVIRAVA